MNNLKPLPEWVAESKKRLALKGENLYHLAEATGFCYGHIRNVMSGQRCSKKTKEKICNYLNISEE